MFIPRRLNHKGQMFGFVKFGGVLKELEKKKLDAIWITNRKMQENRPNYIRHENI